VTKADKFNIAARGHSSPLQLGNDDINWLTFTNYNVDRLAFGEGSIPILANPKHESFAQALVRGSSAGVC
jgi:hypothetical protein